VDFSHFMSGMTFVLAAVLMVSGFRNRQRDGYARLLNGSSLVALSTFLLLTGYVTKPVLIALSLVALALAVAATVLPWVRARRMQR
jgi:hypothetical protein